jgi:hypothetical protein
MHILLAQQFGCKYIASFDSDFRRVKDIVTEETGMRVLVSPDEILSVLWMLNLAFPDGSFDQDTESAHTRILYLYLTVNGLASWNLGFPRSS